MPLCPTTSLPPVVGDVARLASIFIGLPHFAAVPADVQTTPCSKPKTRAEQGGAANLMSLHSS